MRKSLLAAVTAACIAIGYTGVSSAKSVTIDSVKSSIDNDAYVDNSETLYVSGSGFSAPIVAVKIEQYINTVYQTGKDIINPTNSVTINAGGKADSIFGPITVNGLAYGSGIDSIKIGVVDGTFSGVFSGYRKVDDAPPVGTIFTASSNTTGDEDSVKLRWLGGSDQGTEGIAVSCTIKYASYLINSEQHWDSSSTHDLPCPEPALIGYAGNQDFWCNMWDYGQATGESTYFYAIKYVDNMGNVSSITSNAYYSEGAIAAKPVNLSSFAAVMQGRAVALNWRTESETDNACWKLKRSAGKDGPYETIKEIRKTTGTYTTNFPTPYEYIDTDGISANQTYYYKLYDVALDGNETEHGPVSTDGLSLYNGKITDNPLMLDAIEPNPVRYGASFSFAIGERAFTDNTGGITVLDVSRLDGSATYRVFDAYMYAGQSQNVVWNRADAEAGIYIVRLSTASHSVVRRMMVIER